MSNYDDYDDPRSGGYGRAPPPYPSSGVGFNDYGGSMPPTLPGGADVPPPPMGDNRRPSALKRSGSRSRVPHLQPQFPDEGSYLGSTAHDLEGKNRRRHREFRDKRDGYESEEGEMHRASKGGRGQRGDWDNDRRRCYDDGDRRRRDRDRDRDYDDPPSRHRKRDPPGVEYGSDPVPAVKRAQTDRDPRRTRRRDDYDDDDDDYDRPPPRRRRSHDDTGRRRRDDDDRSDYTRDDRRRRDERSDRDRDRDRSRDDRRRDRSRRRYSDEDSEYDDRRNRDKRSDRRRSSAPPKEIKIGDYDIGPWLEKGKKLAPILTPIAMQMAKKYMGGSKR